MAISEMTLTAPPVKDMAALYSELFVEIFGEQAYRSRINPSPSWQYDLNGSYEGSTRELLAQIQQKLLNDGRKTAFKPKLKGGQLTLDNL